MNAEAIKPLFNRFTTKQICNRFNMFVYVLVNKVNVYQLHVINFRIYL